MLHLITNIVSVNNDFSVVCTFNTGEKRRIDFSAWVNQFRLVNDGWASQICDINYFKNVHLDSYGTLSWDNQLDFCPDVLYAMSQSVSE